MADIQGTSGNDTLNGTGDADTITGLAGNDIINGNAGDDTLNGGEGNDTFTGGTGDDIILGYHGDGDVAVYSGNSADYVISTGIDAQGSWVRVAGQGAFANEGTDTLRYVELLRFADRTVQMGINPNNRPVLGQPRLVDQSLLDGTAFEFSIPATTFIDLDSTDVLRFRAVLEDGSPLPTWLIFDPVGRRFSGTPPLAAGGSVINVRVFASDQNPGDPGYEISDSFEIIIREARGADIVGTADNDILSGTVRAERMIGGEGNDIFLGSAGSDIMFGGPSGPADLIDYSGSPSGIYANLNNGLGSGGYAEGDVLNEIEDIIGSAFDDHLIDTDGQGDIRGGNGNDYIAGRLGGDRLTGGAGADVFGYFTRADSYGDSSVFRVPAGNNAFQGSAGDRITDFSPGTDRLDFSLITVLSSAVSVMGSLTRLTLETPEGQMAIEFDGVFTLGQLLDNQVRRQTGDDGNNAINGTNDVDRIFALAGDDALSGLGGDDILSGGAGHDLLVGGDGNDVLYGGSYNGPAGELTGNDRLEGGDGGDELYGGDGNDILDGGSGSDIMLGGLGDDTYYSDRESDVIRDDGGNDTLILGYLPTLSIFADIFENIVLNFVGAANVFGGTAANNITGNASSNFLRGGDGDDQLYGLGGDDNLAGDAGADQLFGGDGDDGFDGGAGADQMVGGAGDDRYQVDDQFDLVFENTGGGFDTVTAHVSHYLHANVESLGLVGFNNENLFGVGNDLNNDISGNNGDNLLIAGGGDDYVLGRAGADLLFGQDGADLLRGNDGVDYLVGGLGNDRLLGDADADAIYGEDGDDYLEGGASFHTDILVGGAGNDLLWGISEQTNPDYDLLDGGSGDDSYYVDTGDDLTFEAAGGGIDTVYANVTVPNAGVYLYANVENLVLQGSTAFGVGNELNNQIAGNQFNNYLLGGAGNDTLNGWDGSDVLFGEAGNDIFVFTFNPFRDGDVIADFTRGEDRIDLSASRLTFAQIQSRFVQVGNNGAIQFVDGNVLVLHNVNMSQLTAADFILTAAAEGPDVMDVDKAFGDTDLGSDTGALFIDMPFADSGLERWGVLSVVGSWL